MKKTSLAIVGLVLLAGFAQAQAVWMTGSVDEALAKAKASGKLLLLDFFTSGG
jgi:hypothetical protein